MYRPTVRVMVLCGQFRLSLAGVNPWFIKSVVVQGGKLPGPALVSVNAEPVIRLKSARLLPEIKPGLVSFAVIGPDPGLGTTGFC